MAKFHIRDNGEPGRCVATSGRCKYGAEEEHHSSPAEARVAYERQQGGHSVSTLTRTPDSKAGTVSKASARINRALESDLSYSGPTPKWLKQLQKESQSAFDSPPPMIIDVIDTSAGKAAVVWEENSMASNDQNLWQKGFVVRNTVLYSMKTGEKIGYVKATFVDDSAATRAFGDDKWASLRYMDETSGRSFGCRTRVPSGRLNRRGREITEKVDSLSLATTDDEKALVLKEMWAKSHIAMSLAPVSYDHENSDYRPFEPESGNAPDDPKVFEKDMKQILKLTDKKYKEYRNDFKDPYVDYANMDSSLKGEGLGSALYVYSARMLAKEGKSLRSSEMQSEDAKSVWNRFKSDERLPIKSVTHTFKTFDKKQQCYVLDFRGS